MKKEQVKKKDFKFKNFHMFLRAVRQLWKESPLLIPATCLCAILSAVYPYIGIILSAQILTELVSPVENREHLIFLAVLMVGLNFIGRLILNFMYQFVDVLKYKQMKLLDRSAAVKAWQMDYGMLADPGVHEKRMLIGRWLYNNGLLAIVRQINTLLNALFTIGISIVLSVEFFSAKAVGEGSFVGFLNHWSAPVVFVLLFGFSTGYSIWASAKIQKRNYEIEKDISEPVNKSYSLLDASCFEYQRGKDLRVFHAQRSIAGQLGRLYDEMVKIFEEGISYSRAKELITLLLNQIFNLLVYFFVGMKAFFGAVGVGSILKYTEMVSQLGQGITMLFGGVQDILNNVRYINDYYEYLDMENASAQGKLLVTEEIKDDYELEFRNVTFTYPGASVPSLVNVSCKLKKGEKMAVVGPNGSGKSTFIKLLCRLYDPQEGQILLNGVDIREYKYDEYLKMFSTVFQDFALFAFELGENVAAGENYEEDKVRRALENAGFGERLASLPKRIRTDIFKYFSEDGVELSGGEQQKVAVARCLYKNAPYAILDEPTSALDPIAEADLYQRMNEFVEDKGAIYISHRLSSCHFCDRILVFCEGALVQEGTHNALVHQAGLYKRMWDAQAKYYQNSLI